MNVQEQFEGQDQPLKFMGGWLKNGDKILSVWRAVSKRVTYFA